MKFSTRKALAASTIALLALTACGSDEASTSETSAAVDTSAASETTEAASETTEAGEEHLHWSYEGEGGPENWGSLSEEYVTCADGSAQTPIDIVDPATADLADPVLNYTAGAATVINNGHTIQANAAEGNTMTVNGVEYPFLQIHFHASSEHTINGESFPAEVHFVHKTEDGKIAVLGVMIAEGAADNAAWAPFTDAMGTEEEAETPVELDWAAMLPTSKLSYRYAGSLTTPPCTEGVSWVLLDTPVELSAAQIAAMAAAYDDNHRPVQPLNGRTVELDSSEG